MSSSPTAAAAGGAALGSAKWIFAVNALQKGIGFVLNQALVLHTSPEIFGLAAIQLELLLSSLLFLSREGVRLVSLRAVVRTRRQRQLLVNLSWLPAAFIASCILCLLAAHACSTQQSSSATAAAAALTPALLTPTKHIDLTVVIMYSVGALLEALAEPGINLPLASRADVAPRLRAEVAATFVRSCATFVFVARMGLGVRGFGLAQLAHGLTYLLTVARGTLHESLLPAPADREEGAPRAYTHSIVSLLGLEGDLFDAEQLALATALTGSSLLKHLLTEADRITLSLTASAHEQGVYAAASNYGSLVARLVLQPLEEASRQAFSRLQGVDRDRLLFSLLRLLLPAAALLPAVGPGYVGVTLQLLRPLLRSPLVNDGHFADTLRAYCCYLFVLAANGVTEAYVLAVAPPSVLNGVNGGYAVSSAVYVLAAVPLVRCLRAPGVVAAAAAAMAVRVASSLRVIYGLSSGSDVDRSLLPGPGSGSSTVAWAALALHGAASMSEDMYMYSSARGGRDALWHVLRGCAAVALYSQWAFARRDLRSIWGAGE